MLNPFSLNIYSHVKKLGHPMPVFFFFLTYLDIWIFTINFNSTEVSNSHN